MKGFRLIIHRKALEELKSLPTEDRERLLDSLFKMEEKPFIGDVKPVRGLKGVFRKG